jgi:HD-like signal output (HDOD) protein
MDIDLFKWNQTTISQDSSYFSPPVDMRQSVSKIKELPPFPATANKILKLASDPLADARKLADIIELDPLLATQVIRWASSAFYGYRGKISTPHDAITKVLGFDFVLNLALGLAALSPLKAPVDGVIGSRSLWIQALASTRLMAILSKHMPQENRPESQHIFLAGLMHNIGFLLLSHQFKKEYNYLNNFIDANPTLAINTIENFAFGYDHTQLGAWLLQVWSMPKPILDIVFHHHNPNYRCENHQLNLLVFVNDYLLGKHGIGDAVNQVCPETVYDKLGITETECEQSLEELAGEFDEIRSMVNTLLT